MGTYMVDLTIYYREEEDAVLSLMFFWRFLMAVFKVSEEPRLRFAPSCSVVLFDSNY